VIERDQAGGALCSAHVPRLRPAVEASSFTSLRRARHRPDPAPSTTLDENIGSAKDMGWPMERSKGGGGSRRLAPGDMSAIGHPVALAARCSIPTTRAIPGAI
jgi:hypothetical protein